MADVVSTAHCASSAFSSAALRRSAAACSSSLCVHGSCRSSCCSSSAATAGCWLSGCGGGSCCCCVACFCAGCFAGCLAAAGRLATAAEGLTFAAEGLAMTGCGALPPAGAPPPFFFGLNANGDEEAGILAAGLVRQRGGAGSAWACSCGRESHALSQDSAARFYG